MVFLYAHWPLSIKAAPENLSDMKKQNNSVRKENNVELF